jgi:hypothetical protein
MGKNDLIYQSAKIGNILTNTREDEAKASNLRGLCPLSEARLDQLQYLRESPSCQAECSVAGSIHGVHLDSGCLKQALEGHALSFQVIALRVHGQVQGHDLAVKQKAN